MDIDLRQLSIDLYAYSYDATKAYHWISSDHHECCFAYCWDCAKKISDEVKKEHLDDEVIIDGGWVTEEEDHAYCTTCGHLLRYSLLPILIDVEWFNFDSFDPINKVAAFELQAMIEAISYEPKKHPELYEKLVEVCKKVVIPKIANDEVLL